MDGIYKRENTFNVRKIKGMGGRNLLLTKMIAKSCSFDRQLPQGLCDGCLLGSWEIASAPSLIFELLQEEERP